MLGPILLGAALAAAPGLPPSALAVEHRGEWLTWWRAEQAPARWAAPHPALERAARWRAVRPGMETGELRLGGSGEAWRTRVILLRFDPRRFRIGLERAVEPDGLAGAWTIDSAGADALAAFNAGQFSAGRPWGWVVEGGRETSPPGRGPLAMAVALDDDGRFHWLEEDSIGDFRGAGRARLAFQSYPVLLWRDGQVPPPLRAPGRGVDVAHRDSRLAIGELRDGRIVVALTRFDALGGVLSSAPFGPTIPELAAVMGALGCRSALALDGGISGQLLLRERGQATRHPAWRRVPLGIVVEARR